MSVDGIQTSLSWINLKGPTSSLALVLENMLNQLVSINIILSYMLALLSLKSKWPHASLWGL